MSHNLIFCSSYDAGDHVAIYPVNDESIVNKLFELIGENPETVFSLTNLDEDSSKKVPFPCPCTYRTALTHYIDICSLPRTHILKELAEYTVDPEVRVTKHCSSLLCDFNFICFIMMKLISVNNNGTPVT